MVMVRRWSWGYIKRVMELQIREGWKISGWISPESPSSVCKSIIIHYVLSFYGKFAVSSPISGLKKRSVGRGRGWGRRKVSHSDFSFTHLISISSGARISNTSSFTFFSLLEFLCKCFECCCKWVYLRSIANRYRRAKKQYTKPANKLKIKAHVMG